MIGQTLNNRYKIISRLGEGGMGEVYLAIDEQTNQQVAIKILARQLTSQPDALERFRREAETLRQLDHPNIVKFLNTFEFDGQYIIVMEYLSGGSLHDLIKQGPLKIEQTYQISIELCDALIRSHHLNIIHRDLKPENILLTENRKAKLADFGVARLSEGTRMTRTGTQVGTPYYMAPEAWGGKPLNEQADIWSLGIIFFEMLTGQVPFHGDTPLAVMAQVNTASLPNLKKLRKDTPASLIKIIKRMLTRDKKWRYQTMREVGLDLEKSQKTPETSITGNITKNITNIKSKVSSLAKSRPKIASKTRITSDENKAKPKLFFKPIHYFGLIIFGLIVLINWNRLTTLFSPDSSPLSPLIVDSTSQTDSPLIVTPTITVTSTPDLSINARIAEVCRANICIYDGLKQIIETIEPNPSTLKISSHSIPSWSPDGTQLVFSEGDDTAYSHSLYILNIQSEEFIKLTINNEDNNLFPSWSPNGEMIAYHRNCYMRIISPDQTINRQLNSGASPNRCATIFRWSPDSKILAWAASNENDQNIGFGIIEVETNHSAYLEYEFAPDQQIEMAWSPDGSRLNLFYPDVGYSSFFSVSANCSESECFIDDLQIENTSYPPASWLPNYYPQWDRENIISNTDLLTLTPSPSLEIGSTHVSAIDGMTLVYVPAGEFTMGSEYDDSDEKPAHQVYLDAYWIDQTEVTNAMYAKCVNAKQCNPPTSTSSYTHQNYFGNSQFDNYPVMYVSWNDAVDYCTYIGRKLPSEAEWEKAARGTNASIYTWGNTDPKGTLLNFNRIVDDTTEVGSYPDGASIYGALDMAGNLWEWVSDWYDNNYYQSSPTTNPKGPDSGQYKVLRGGSWFDTFSNLFRSAYRGKSDPSNTRYDFGFRCAKDIFQE